MIRDMQAVIMAGGEGSRLRPLTSNMPKPMLPVANRPLMEHIIMLLRKHGVTDVVATVQFLSSVIRNYFGDGSDLGVSLSYATEDVPLGTAGSVYGARDLLNGPFLVISGDALTDIDLDEVVRFHRDRNAAATLVLKRVPDPLEFGIVMTDEEGRIERFLEKPTWGQVFSDTINTGIYVLEPEVLDLIPPDQPYDFSSELFPLMLDKGLPIVGFVADGYWADVGNTDAFIEAHHDALQGKVQVDIEGFEYRPGVWVGEDVSIHPTATIAGPAIIGDNSTIGPGASIGANTTIGLNVTVGPDASITGGVLLDRAYIAPSARIASAVAGRRTAVERGAMLEEGAVLGDDVVVGAGAVVNPRVKVYPSRDVEAGAIVTTSVVTDRRATRHLFGARGVSGVVNVGVTPTVAVRLGSAYGTTLPRGSTVVTGRDTSRAARTIKRALIAGLNATGVTVHDLELTPAPVTRFTVGVEQAAGGITVRTSPRDPETVEIRLLDGEGADLPEAQQRKIERIFFREEYRRATVDKLGELEFPPRALERYTAGLTAAVDSASIRRRVPKVVVDYAYGAASLVGPALLGRLGCDVLSLNAYTDETRPVLTQEDLRTLLERVATHVRDSGSDLGVLLEPGGEVAHLVDGRGRVVPGHALLLSFLRHEISRGARRVAVPVSAPSACAALATEAGAEVVTTPVSSAALMSFAARPDVGFAGNAYNTLIFPDHLPAPDGLMTFAKALEMVALTQLSLGDIVDSAPAVRMAQREVATPWHQKGAVMRHVANSADRSEPDGSHLLLLDGVKVVDSEEWALVIPFPDEPACGIWTEAPTQERADALAERYAMLVTEAVESDADPATSRQDDN